MNKPVISKLLIQVVKEPVYLKISHNHFYYAIRNRTHNERYEAME
jgi:hypothetical protein